MFILFPFPSINSVFLLCPGWNLQEFSVSDKLATSVWKEKRTDGQRRSTAIWISLPDPKNKELQIPKSTVKFGLGEQTGSWTEKGLEGSEHTEATWWIPAGGQELPGYPRGQCWLQLCSHLHRWSGWHWGHITLTRSLICGWLSGVMLLEKWPTGAHAAQLREAQNPVPSEGWPHALVADGWSGKQLYRKGSVSPGGQSEHEPAMCPWGRMAQSILGCFKGIRPTLHSQCSCHSVIPRAKQLQKPGFLWIWVVQASGPSSSSPSHSTAPLCCQRGHSQLCPLLPSSCS